MHPHNLPIYNGVLIVNGQVCLLRRELRLPIRNGKEVSSSLPRNMERLDIRRTHGSYRLDWSHKQALVITEDVDVDVAAGVGEVLAHR